MKALNTEGQEKRQTSSLRIRYLTGVIKKRTTLAKKKNPQNYKIQN